MGVAAVVFDLDDTLYLEREYAFSGFSAVAEAFPKELGDPVAAAARLRELFDSPHRPRVFDALMAETGGTDAASMPQLVARMVETYRSHQPSIALCPDADGALTRLRDRFKLGLITDGPPGQQWLKIDALGLRPRLDEIIVTGELGAGYAKPSPAAFELMAGRLGVACGECVYVADNAAKDFVGPNGLGWLTVRIERPAGLYLCGSAPPGGEPDQTITSLARLFALLT